MKISILLAAISVSALAACVSPATGPDAPGGSAVNPAADAGLTAAIANPARAEANKVRDIHRHPGETLSFFGIRPGMTVVEISPGAGYYAEILAPYLAAGGGKYIATGNPIAAIADQTKWGVQTYVPFNATSGPLGAPGSADMVVTFRNVHNWMWQPGFLDKAMRDFADVLKPGGILGVEEHRADPRPETVMNGRAASDGYVAKATIVAAAAKAGLVLDGESEVNANPKDTKDHPFGVWTLPPNSRGPQANATPPAGWTPEKYKAIGESDRHTLRFRKPA